MCCTASWTQLVEESSSFSHSTWLSLISTECLGVCFVKQGLLNIVQRHSLDIADNWHDQALPDGDARALSDPTEALYFVLLADYLQIPALCHVTFWSMSD
eukprot:6472917-Amphidinium_carterae.1